MCAGLSKLYGVSCLEAREIKKRALLRCGEGAAALAEMACCRRAKYCALSSVGKARRAEMCIFSGIFPGTPLALFRRRMKQQRHG